MEPWPEFDHDYGLLYRYAYRLLGSVEAAQDVAQEACLRCVRQGPLAEDAQAVRRWVIVVARNLCFTHLRAAGRHPQRSLDDAHPIGDRRPNPAALAVAAERGLLVRAAVERLPPELREAIVLREYEDLSYAEIAEATGAPLGTVKSRISRARELLRTDLSSLMEDER